MHFVRFRHSHARFQSIANDTTAVRHVMILNSVILNFIYLVDVRSSYMYHCVIVGRGKKARFVLHLCRIAVNLHPVRLCYSIVVRVSSPRQVFSPILVFTYTPFINPAKSVLN